MAPNSLRAVIESKRLTLNRSENTGKFLLRDLAAVTKNIYCHSQHGALMNRFPVMTTAIGWRELPTVFWSDLNLVVLLSNDLKIRFSNALRVFNCKCRPQWFKIKEGFKIKNIMSHTFDLVYKLECLSVEGPPPAC